MAVENIVRVEGLNNKMGESKHTEIGRRCLSSVLFKCAISLLIS